MYQVSAEMNDRFSLYNCNSAEIPYDKTATYSVHNFRERSFEILDAKSPMTILPESNKSNKIALLANLLIH